jgi:hypothetical protein
LIDITGTDTKIGNNNVSLDGGERYGELGDLGGAMFERSVAIKIETMVL